MTTAPPAMRPVAHRSAPSRSLASVVGVTSQLPPIDLDEVMTSAALEARTDKKYLLSPEQFSHLVPVFQGRYRVLDIDHRRAFRYQSVYFDTVDLELYRAHRQQRRHRYKVRTRTYVDSAETMFEVKVKGHRGQTVKHRLPYVRTDPATIDARAATFLADVLWSEYRAPVPGLAPVLETGYRRATLVDTQRQARVTCDVNLSFAGADRRMAGPDVILLETKSATGSTAADEALRAIGVRPTSISKYCICIALLHPHLPANPWNRLLKRHFGWQRWIANGPCDRSHPAQAAAGLAVHSS